MWYQRHHLQTRLALFFAGAALSGAFSGLLAYALTKMNGIGGLAGWRWIFLLEGLLTVVCGIAAHWTLPDNPHTASFLNEEDRQFIVSRLQAEASTGTGRITNDDKVRKEYVFAAFKEWKIWAATICWLGNSVPLYGYVVYAAFLSHRIS